MTYNEKLVTFVQKKAEAIFEQSELFYIVKQDIDSIQEWSEKDSKTIFQVIENFVMFHDLREGELEVSTCPWCAYQTLILNTKCRDCAYGKNHDYCDGPLFSFAYSFSIDYVRIFEEIENNA